MKKALYSLILCITISTQALAEDGYRLWLRYELFGMQNLPLCPESVNDGILAYTGAHGLCYASDKLVQFEVAQ